MTQNASIFTSPNPSMAILSQQIEEFEEAHLLVIHTKTVGASQTRELKRNALWSSLELERAYVQFLCDSTPEKADAIAVGAGMRLSLPTSREWPVLAVSLTHEPGSVLLRASAAKLVGPGKGKAKKRTYLWRSTIDGGHTFVNAEPTPVANTTIVSLPLNTTVGFQVAVKDAVGVGEWSQTVSIFIH